MKSAPPVRNPSLTLQNTAEGKKYLQRIREMTPYERLLYWITERHGIFCRRFPKGYSQQEGNQNLRVPLPVGLPETSPPWTKDPILQTVFFCNPYRENDKVTAYLRDNFREEYRDDECVFLGSILLRWFNYIPTMRVLIGAGIPQRMGGGFKQREKALDLAYNTLASIRSGGGQLFGSAYIIKLFNGIGKLEAIISVMKTLSNKPGLYEAIRGHHMGLAAKILRQFDGMGNFYIYQFIGDLAYTHVFEDVPDWHTWSFSGPGTSRAIHRLSGRDRQADGSVWERGLAIPPGAQKFLDDLRVKVNRDLASRNKDLPKAERLRPNHARDLTGCLCEYDKYCRALNNERTLKRGYEGQG